MPRNLVWAWLLESTRMANTNTSVKTASAMKPSNSLMVADTWVAVAATSARLSTIANTPEAMKAPRACEIM